MHMNMNQYTKHDSIWPFCAERVVQVVPALPHTSYCVMTHDRPLVVGAPLDAVHVAAPS